MSNALTVLPSEFAKYVTDVEIGPAGANGLTLACRPRSAAEDACDELDA